MTDFHQPLGPRPIRLAFGLVALALAISVGCTQQADPERIVLIVVDTLRQDHVSAYGGRVATPNMDRIAANGTVFRNAFSSFHQTSMSMGAMFTGHTPSLESGNAEEPLVWNASSWCGLARFAEGDDETCVPTSLEVLGDTISRAGYWTLGVTPHPLTHRPFGFDRGFDEWVELEGGQNTLLAFRKKTRPRFAALRAADVVNEAVFAGLDARPHDRFFLYVHYLDVHDWHLARISYGEAVANMDVAIGELLDHLDTEGLLDSAVVILTSDHGEALEEKHVLRATKRHLGNPSYRQVLEVPLLVGGARLPEDPHALTRSEDVYRLLARLAGTTDSLPESDLHHDELFVSEQAYRTYLRGEWKSFTARISGKMTLVNLRADPGERHAVGEVYPDVVRSHRERLDELTKVLAAPAANSGRIPEFLLQRLRVLGYLDDEGKPE